MNTTRLFFLLDKYVKDDATNTEINELEQHLTDENLKKQAKTYLKQQYTQIEFPDFLTHTSVTNNLKHIAQRKKVNYFKYAAAIILLLGLANFLRLYNNAPNATGVNNVKSSKEVTLITSDGSNKNLVSNDSIIKVENGVKVKLNKGVLTYSSNTKSKITTYNTLRVPFGKNFSVQLSDGTKVKMNAGSSLKYPVSFSGMEAREVFLEGEAYFDVTKNPNKKFTVITKTLSVEVLGTRFNVSAYLKENEVKTTLEEGAVKVINFDNDANNVMHLLPDEQAVWNKANKTIEKNTVNAQDFIAWTNGAMIFKKNAFWYIQNRLERRFNVSITNLNKELANKRITASFKNKSLEQIIVYLQTLEDFEYSINNTEITIK